jgi:hypothetical protein
MLTEFLHKHKLFCRICSLSGYFCKGAKLCKITHELPGAKGAALKIAPDYLLFLVRNEIEAKNTVFPPLRKYSL